MAVKVPGNHSIFFVCVIILSVIILIQSFKETSSSVYYYSLVDLGLTPWILALLVFITPLLVGPVTGKLGWRNTFLLLGAIIASSRLPMGLGLEQPFHLFFSGVAFSSSATMLSLIFALQRRERQVDPDMYSSHTLTAAFVISLMTLIMFRIAGSGVDISIVPKAAGYLLSPAISGVISLGLGVLVYFQRSSLLFDETRNAGDIPGYRITGGASDSWMPSLGLGGFILVATSMLLDPHVVTAWTGEDFTTASSFTVISMGLFVFSLISGMTWLMALRKGFSNPWGALLGNAIMIGGGFNIFYIGLNIGVTPLAFTWIAMVDLWLILDAITDSEPFAGEPMEVEREDGSRKMVGFPGRKRERRSPSHFGLIMAIGLGLSILVLLLISFSLNWAFLPFGSVFRGGLTVFMMLSVVILAVGGFSCSKGSFEEPSSNLQKGMKRTMGSPTAAAGEGAGHFHTGEGGPTRLRTLFITIGAVTMLIILMTGGLTLAFHSDRVEDDSLEAGEILTVLTYNIHHGFSNDGRIDPVPHLEEIEEIDPDIVFLQEADSLRLTEGNFDPGAYLANKLKMYYFRGAKPGLGNPGTAILSRFPLRDLEVIKLRSDSIQRIAIMCRADLGSVEIGLINVHFGLEEDERRKQFEDLEGLIGEMTNETLIVGGDFNTEPHEKMIAPLDPGVFDEETNTSGNSGYLRSAWHSTEQGKADPDKPTFPAKGLDLEKQHIDYIFVSNDLEVFDSGIEPGEGASDHKPVWARLRI
jgi:endonuclease/exonuclease/phosphatase family metal-dependent hydrolase